jgi:hypothetical protein
MAREMEAGEKHHGSRSGKGRGLRGEQNNIKN